MTETQWAQPATAFTTEASVGRGKGSGVSLTIMQRMENEKSIHTVFRLSNKKPQKLEDI